MDKIRKLITRFLFFHSFVIRLSSFALFIFFLSSFVDASVPHLINYQGRLTDTTGKPVADGSYSITFRLYDAETAGTMLWEETNTSVVVSKGIFSVLLGSVTNLGLAFDKQYYLEIKVGTEVMTPRQRIASAPYAITAEYGVPKGAIIMWSGKIADIPSGWALCDGNNGTPDLRDRFIVGARQDDNGIAKTNVTGSLTINGDGQIPIHNHGVGEITVGNESAHTHTIPYDSDYAGSQPYPTFTKTNTYSFPVYKETTSSGSPHTHILSGNTDNVGSGTKNIAAYYALALIMKL